MIHITQRFRVSVSGFDKIKDTNKNFSQKVLPQNYQKKITKRRFENAVENIKNNDHLKYGLLKKSHEMDDRKFNVPVRVE